MFETTKWNMKIMVGNGTLKITVDNENSALVGPMKRIEMRETCLGGLFFCFRPKRAFSATNHFRLFVHSCV